MNKQLVVLTTSDLENMHKIQLNMLIEFDKICRRNNIKLYIRCRYAFRSCEA